MTEHIRTQLCALNRLEQNGYAFPDRIIRILTTPARALLGQRIADAVGERVVLETLDHDYYDGLRFMISARSTARESIPLIDGGAFNWLAKLTANQKIVFVASAVGAQLLAYIFRPDSQRQT
jgi:hypothetical protein